jgi:hypothetical protein
MRSRGALSDLSILDNITGSEYFNEIMQVDFEGATGRVVLDSVGDRIGYIFLFHSLLQYPWFTFFLYSDAGIWNLRNGTVVTIGRFYGSNDTLSLTQNATFFGGRISVPPDSPLRMTPSPSLAPKSHFYPRQSPSPSLNN